MINEIIERLRKEIERTDGDLWTFDVENVSKVLAKIDRLEDGNERRTRRLADTVADLQKEVERFESFLQEIDTHIRSTPDALPYIIDTMCKFWDYRKGYSEISRDDNE